MRLSNDEYQLYLFSRKYHGWHSYANDATTLKAVRGLAGKGLVQVNQYGQLRGTQPNGEAL